MRKIVDGTTYNTNTSTLIASWAWNDTEEGRTHGTEKLYQTRGGAFFTHMQEIMDYIDRAGEMQTQETSYVFPKTREDAQAWIMKGDCELHNEDAFGVPPEAVAEHTPEATIYTRVPASLKERVEEGAKEKGLSVNSYVLRCLETCLAA